MTSNNRLDAYIAESQPFAQPILTHVRRLVAKHCPEAEEEIKWSSPAWTYKGKLLCSMAAFKGHATFGFWYGSMVTGGNDATPTAMGSFGRLTSTDDLPPETELAQMFSKAKQLIDDGVVPPHMQGRGKHPKPEVTMVPAFETALDGSPKAKAIFDAFPPSQRREYLDWIIEAKRDETRDKRIAQAVIWLAEGKRRNWKYENC